MNGYLFTFYRKDKKYFVTIPFVTDKLIGGNDVIQKAWDLLAIDFEIMPYYNTSTMFQKLDTYLKQDYQLLCISKF